MLKQLKHFVNVFSGTLCTRKFQKTQSLWGVQTRSKSIASFFVYSRGYDVEAHAETVYPSSERSFEQLFEEKHVFFNHFIKCFVLKVTSHNGKSGFSFTQSDKQPNKSQRSTEVEMVLPDVSETMQGRGKMFIKWVFFFRCIRCTSKGF